MNVPTTLLGLLEPQASHGYELKREYDSLFADSGRPLSFGQLYTTLARLERDGQIVVHGSEPGEGPERKRYAITPNGVARLQRWLAEPSLWDGYLSLLRHNGFRVDSPDVRFEAYRVIAGDRERYGQLWDLAEALVDHDQNWSLWRARHVLMAERQIGTKPGTGGSAGGAYLRSRIELRFYPELWELRSRL